MRLLLLLFFLSFSAFASPTKINLTPENTVVFRDAVTSNSIGVLQQDLFAISAGLEKDDIIYLVIDSPGGSIPAGLDMQDIITLIPQKIHTISIFAASMGFFLSQLGDQRFITERGVMMGHRAKGGFEGQFENGEIESQLALWKKIVRSMEEFLAEKMGISLEKYKEKTKDEMWLYGKEAVSENAADDVVQIICSPELIKQVISVETTTMTLFGPMSKKSTYSGCPLIRNPLGKKEEIEQKAKK